MNMKLKLIIAFQFVVLLTILGCGGPRVKSNVTVFHALPENVQPIKYAFIPLKHQETSLEYSAYKKIIESEFSAIYWQSVPLEEASVFVLFDYGIGAGQEQTGFVPVFGQTGVASSSTYGTFSQYGNYGTYSGTTKNYPRYGITGYHPYSGTVYPRWLWLHILKKESANGKASAIYETQVKSTGRSDQLPVVVKSMIRALFKDFPGKSGSTRTVINRAEIIK